MIRIVLIFNLLAPVAFGQYFMDIKGSKCADYISSNYGINSSRLCLKGRRIYTCSDTIENFALKAPEKQFGARMPKSFFDKFKINKRELKSSLEKACDRKATKATKQKAFNCRHSGHSLFNKMLDEVGVFNASSCFCDDYGEQVISICKKKNGEWHSTGEFSSKNIRGSMELQCDLKKNKAYKISCFCTRNYTEDDELINCLSEHTNKKKTKKYIYTTNSPNSAGAR